jgi:hypothetical protein
MATHIHIRVFEGTFLGEKIWEIEEKRGSPIALPESREPWEALVKTNIRVPCSSSADRPILRLVLPVSHVTKGLNAMRAGAKLAPPFFRLSCQKTSFNTQFLVEVCF